MWLCKQNNKTSELGPQITNYMVNPDDVLDIK